MIEIIKSFVLISILIYFGFGILLFIMQRNFMYMPTPVVEHSYDEEAYSNDGETIKVVVVNRQKKNAILYFGGNMESVEYNAADFIEIFPDHAIFLVKYRGYGGSSGSPEEQAIYSDSFTQRWSVSSIV